MKRAQGNKRSNPDGFLHLNNFSHVKASGLAGVLFERIFSERQQDIVEEVLIELAGPDNRMFKHDCWRFKKEFLIENFKSVVYGACDLLKISASAMLAIASMQERADVVPHSFKFK